MAARSSQKSTNLSQNSTKAKCHQEQTSAWGASRTARTARSTATGPQSLTAIPSPPIGLIPPANQPQLPRPRYGSTTAPMGSWRIWPSENPLILNRFFRIQA